MLNGLENAWMFVTLKPNTHSIEENIRNLDSKLLFIENVQKSMKTLLECQYSEKWGPQLKAVFKWNQAQVQEKQCDSSTKDNSSYSNCIQGFKRQYDLSDKRHGKWIFKD